MSRAIRSGILLMLAISFLLPTTPVLAEGVAASVGSQRSIASYRFFPETGHSVSGAFLTFFDRYGGIDVFGYPLTEAWEEDGRLVQYFQRHRMEYWPENPPEWRVQLSLLGDVVLGPASPPVPKPADPSLVFYPQTGHALGSSFRQFYDSHGGPVIFGYPTSEAYEEGGHWVQRFQRARLEYRPENPPAFHVEPGLLGVVYLQRLGKEAQERMKPVTPTQAASEWILWGSWTTSTADFLPSKVKNNQVAVAAIDGTLLAPGQAFNFNRVLYLPGYVPGLGYGMNNLFQWMRGGGVCAAATGLYRAAYNAGLAIPQATPHTLASYPPYGWDATVEEGSIDLVIVNDTPTQLRLRARLDVEAKQMQFWVEGRQPPDRTVVRRGPVTVGELSYEVFRDITYADGRQRNERRAIRYAGIPAPVPPEVLKAEPKP